jgi:DNA primase
MITEKTIDQIRAEATALRVAEILRLELKKRGGRWWASCPLHNDKNPSFCIGPPPEVWYCHACAIGGDGIGLYRAVEGVGFIPALRQLADHLGIPVEPVSRRQAQAAKDQELAYQKAEYALHGRNFARSASRERLTLADRRRLVAAVLDEPEILSDAVRAAFRQGFSTEWELLRARARCQLRAPGKSRPLTTEENRP